MADADRHGAPRQEELLEPRGRGRLGGVGHGVDVLVGEIGLRLERLGRAEEAVTFLTPWRKRHPNEFWINVRLASALSALAEDRRAARYAFAAVALRPLDVAPWIRLALQYAEAFKSLWSCN